ncbi:hypothetical protein LSH36_751g01047 [Paralvinella palmiformis]|uniref:Ion transport domain-containing protein n=1 Tax=Paralvinella palmiformis TaxID=53620 RepID=A0AAD9J203_9ANNE|nr:hypothetical protein LSH36_751g01047 [Paralvinella palmiformis]
MATLDSFNDHVTPNGSDVYHQRSSTYLEWMIAEIQNNTHAKISAKRQNTRFFQIVTGGNVRFVKRVVSYLKDNAMHAELQWIFGDAECPFQRLKKNRERQSVLMAIFNRLMFLFVLFLYVGTSPLFYVWHAILHNAYLGLRRKSSKEADLPLIFALLSEEKEMVQLFLDNGASVHSQDDHGNNIYHYLADISDNNPNKAIQCHTILCSCFDDVSQLRQVVTEQENDLGLTGFEAIAKYGSLRFFRLISHDESCIGKPLLRVSKDEIWADTQDEEYHILVSEQVTKGKNRKSTRKSTRSHETSANPNGVHTVNLNVLEFDVSKYEQGDFLGRQSYPLQLIASRGVDEMPEIDVNAILESKLVGQWMGTKFKQYMPFCLLGHMLYVSVTVMLLSYIAHHDGYPYPYQLLPPFLKNYRQELAKLLQTNKTHGDHVNITVPTYEDVAYDLEENSTCLDTQIYVVGDPYPFQGCQVDAAVKIHRDCDSITLTNILGEIFIMNPEENDRLLRTNWWLLFTIAAILGSTALLYMILKLGFLFVNYNFRASSPLGAVTPILSRRLPGSYTDRQLVTFMCVFFAFYVYTEKQLRLLLTNIDMLSSLDGSDVNRTKELVNSVLYRLDKAVEDQKQTESVCTTLLIICLLLQFLHAIHALRLLPGIGFFVITTKKMAKHLVQFAIVFVIVSLAFATIFHFVMREKDCPALKMAGFTGLSESLFSTYQVALGQGEHEFTYNFNSKLAYTTYTVITVLLLLNLIIAVMTTTAQELNRLPWKHALCRFELWDEILGTEVTVLTMKSLFGRLVAGLKRACSAGHEQHERQQLLKTFEIIYTHR